MEHGIRIRTVILLWLLFSGVSGIFAQSCLPEGIIFTTQAQIDNFPSLYPNCIHIDSCVGIYGSNINNLDSLIQLKSIGSWLDIMYMDSLVSIEGLSNITHVGGEIKIIYNDILTSLSGLNNLDSTNESFYISHNDALLNIEDLEGLTTVNNLMITGNNSLKTLEGIGNLSTVNGDLHIGGYNLESLTNFNQLNYINGYLFITNIDSLENLGGFEYLDSIGDNFRLLYALKLSNIDALGNLKKIGGGFELLHNSNLANVNGLQNLKSIGGGMIIQGCSNLNTFSGLDSLTSLGGILVIRDNISLSSLTGIDNIDSESVTKLTIASNSQLSFCEVKSVCDFLASPNGTVEINSNAIGCNNQAQVEEACTVSVPEQPSNPPLTIYPNPFTTSTTIEYELTEPSHVQLTIYNALGETIRIAVDRMMPQGKHSFTWTADRLPEGMYYGVLRSAKGVAVVKMVKQR